ncbi:hypothetical protein O3P69_003247 [Scylla paramamosain]|uniref:Uncharacterized protein n=1 Tax=Scylla paramamosain TaxID=85552 RepID=A0AAW0UJZ8_SCYPA
MPFVLQHFGGLLRSNNLYVRLFTHHRVWSFCVDWHSDQQARKACSRSLRSGRLPDPTVAAGGLLGHISSLPAGGTAASLTPSGRQSHDSRKCAAVRHVVARLSRYSLSAARKGRSSTEANSGAKARRAQKASPKRCHTQEDITVSKGRHVPKDIRVSKDCCAPKAPPPPSGSPPRGNDSSAHNLNTLTTMTQSVPGPVSRNTSVSPESQTSSTSSRLGQDRCTGPCTNGRPRPRSMDESPFSSSPPSPELDQILICPRPTFSSIRPYSEILEAISRRVRQALLSHAGKGDRPLAKSAPASP